MILPRSQGIFREGRVAIKILLIIDNAPGHPQSISIEDEKCSGGIFDTKHDLANSSTRPGYHFDVSRPRTFARSSRCFEQPLRPKINFKSWTAANPSPLLMQ